MKKLILLRHAKSSWENPDIEDHDRPLNGRGTAACPVMADWLRTHRYVPDIVLCSSSKRTRQTVKGLRRVIDDLPKACIDPRLYHASPTTMRQYIAELPDRAQTVMLVGHQPGLSAFTRMLADGEEQRRCRRAYEHFPTAAAAVLQLDIDHWSDLEYAQARFIDFAVPRELMAA